MPDRIQRKRTAGSRLPPGAVIVDRTTRWGNPWTVAGAIEAGFADNPADARALCVAQHRAWLEKGPDVVWSGKRQFDRRIVLAEISVLRGLDLACPCPVPGRGLPDVCHARNLMALANAPRSCTPERHNPDGSKTFKMKRACNGCHEPIGDVTPAEVAAGMDGLPLPDVTWECPRCSAILDHPRGRAAVAVGMQAALLGYVNRYLGPGQPGHIPDVNARIAAAADLLRVPIPKETADA